MFCAHESPRLRALCGSALLAVLAAAGCSDDVPTDVDAAASSSDSQPTAEHGAASSSDSQPTAEHGAESESVVTMADGSVVGSSQLVRTPNGVNFRLSTTDLEPGHAYTLWIVIFNDPDECAASIPGLSVCGEPDILNDDARPDMMFAAGSLVGGSGSATFAGQRSVADLSGSANGPVEVPAYGLEDPFEAVIWLVVHDHGPKLPGFLPDMIQTIDGGCTDAGVPEAGAPSPWNGYDGPAGVGAYGERGPNTCASVQLAVHGR